ncbi:hypothetical protein TKK_0015493 [Trichogramma kaykai]
MLANFKYLKVAAEIYIKLELGKKILYLNINDIYNKLGEQLISAFVVCHIFTGMYCNPSFFRKGKKRPFSLLKNNKKFQEMFAKLA